MKKSRQMLWREPTGASQWNRSGFVTEHSMAGELSLFLLCTMLFFGSACSMIQEVFGWEAFGFGMMFRVFVVCALTGGLCEMISLLSLKRAFFGKLLLGITGGIGSILYLLYGGRTEQIVRGLRDMGVAYLEYWFSYYKREIEYSAWNETDIMTALSFVLSVLGFILVWWSRGKRQNSMPVVVPFMVLMLFLVVGQVPEGPGIPMMFFGILLSNAGVFRNPDFGEAWEKNRRKNPKLRYFSWIPAGLCLILFCIVIRAIGASAAQESVDDGKKRLTAEVKRTTEAVLEWDGWDSVKVTKSFETILNKLWKGKKLKVKNNPDADFAELVNDTPPQDGDPVLKLLVDEIPKKGLYLTDFYAGKYKDNIWATDVDAFRQACEEAGFSYEELSEGISSVGGMAISRELFGEDTGKAILGTLQYAEDDRKKACFPYFSFPEIDKLQADGEGRYLKDEDLSQLDFVSWDYNVEDLAGKIVEGKTTYESWELWYDGYVEENYLEVPEGMEQVDRVAAEIEGSSKNFFSVKGGENENLSRLNKAYQVADWLRSNTDYSLELSELPKGMDPIEYFLGTGRQGYCMHYASAGVMLLRKMGVPARYASGFVANDFQKDKETGNYEAMISDKNGHAWAEIYLDGMGWIPVEMTKGYSVSTLGELIFDAEREPVPGAEVTGTPEKPGMIPEKPQPAQPTFVPFPTLTPGKDSQTLPGTPGGNENASGAPGGNNAAGKPEKNVFGRPEKQEKKKEPFSVNPVILYVVLAVMLISVPVGTALKTMQQDADERRILKKFGNQENGQRIRTLNTRLYGKLRRRGRLHGRNLSDEEYGRALLKQSTAFSGEEKERYMCLVKEAAFSENDFTEEETEFCHKIYHRILYERTGEEMQ